MCHVGRCMVAAAPAFIACAGWAGDIVLGSLNFENQTASRVVQTVAEQASNKKEVEYGDFDNDSDLDVVVANSYSDFGSRRNKFYRNDGGVLNEITETLIPEFLNADVSRNAFFRDYNNDGFLDIYINNDGNTSGQGGTDKLYLSQHADGVVTGFTQIDQPTSPLSPECGGVSIDVDGDGDYDIYKGNYPNNTQDQIWLNNGSGAFSFASELVPTDNDYTSDVASADMNGDGRLDILLSNWQRNKLYLNNNNGAGSGDGDYAYTGGVVTLGDATSNQNAMEPGDFDGDGDNDVYWSDRFGNGDRILINAGNDASNVPQFTLFDQLPQSVVARTSRKASVADLNDDGRLDLIVFKQDATNSRPTVLRNTTVNGQLSFVDWTPAPAFPNSASTHTAWHGAIFDSNGDGDLDLFLGGWSNEHLFEQIPVTGTDEADIAGGDISSVFNGQPIAILGSAAVGASDSFVISGLTGTTANPAFISAIASGDGDVLLELLDGETVIVSSDRGALGVEEAFQASGLAGTRTLRVTVLDGDGGGSNPADFDNDNVVGPSDLAQLLATWGKCAGCVTDLDGDDNVGPSDLANLLAAWGPVTGGEVAYTLEILSRN